ncbi:MAG: transglutaminase-like cysteine peptidase [Rhodocyclaceae bacterium]|nr:transglutaminase-like cysteine peptidase [Rhodocyclaceae bacterium]
MCPFGANRKLASIPSHDRSPTEAQDRCRRHRGWRTLLGLLVGCALLTGAVATDLAGVVRLAEQRYGPPARRDVLNWLELIESARGLDEQRQLALVNDFFNRRIRFDEDIRLWQQPDYWATPLETIGIGAGDCEDFSVAKYMTLKALGLPVSKMRLIYVRARLGGPPGGVVQAHMVLGYYATPTAEPLVLDNLVGEIRPAARRPDLFPIFSFNGEGLWVGGAASSSADPTSRLSRWRDLLARMRDDGLE